MPDMLSRVKFYRLRKQVLFYFCLYIHVQVISNMFRSVVRFSEQEHIKTQCMRYMLLAAASHVDRTQTAIMPLLCFLTIEISSLFNYLSSISADSIEAEYSRSYAGINKFIDSSFYTNTNRWYNLHCWSVADEVLLC